MTNQRPPDPTKHIAGPSHRPPHDHPSRQPQQGWNPRNTSTTLWVEFIYIPPISYTAYLVHYSSPPPRFSLYRIHYWLKYRNINLDHCFLVGPWNSTHPWSYLGSSWTRSGSWWIGLITSYRKLHRQDSILSSFYQLWCWSGQLTRRTGFQMSSCQRQ